MNVISRKDFLKAGAALPLALQSLDLRAAAKPKPATPPKLPFKHKKLLIMVPKLSLALYLARLRMQLVWP